MYVSFLDGHQPESPTFKTQNSTAEEIAIILISPDKESFFSLQKMRDDVVNELERKGSLDIIKNAARQGRVKLTDGTLVEGKDEKKIFAALGVPWRPPEHRIC